MTLTFPKKNILAFAALIFIFGSKNFGQPYTLGKFQSQTESKRHMSFFNYVFDRSYMIITNEYAKDSAVKTSPIYIQYPYATRKIQVYGPTVGFVITANGNSTDFPNPSKTMSMGAILMDAIFKDVTEERLKKGQPFKLFLSKAEMDSIVKNEKKFDLAALQVRIIKNRKIVTDWKNVSQLRTLTQANSLLKGGFVVYNDQLEINDQLVITFRNKKDTSLIQFEFERMDSPLLPFLAVFQRDTTSISYVNFVKKVLEKNVSSKSTINEFYRYWPVQHRAGLGIILKKDRIFADTKLAFFFRKPDPDYVDTTLEYVLASGRIKDSLWQTTGHTLILSDFTPGADYTLLIRYKSAPANIQAYTFHTLPKWYQTTKYRYILAGLIALVLFALLFLFYRIRLKKEKNKNASLSYGLKSIRSQLNPHFVFNALSSIQGLINKNDIPGANHYLTEFSNLLRESLRNNDKELVPLDTELKILETYLKLEQLRFQFHYEIDIDNRIDKNAVEIPALLLQPIIENAIKHGVSSLNEKGEVKIRFSNKGNDLMVSVADNGKGFTNNTPATGFGLKLTKDRIHLLNQTLKSQPIELSIESSQNTGTTVHLVFKNWL